MYERRLSYEQLLDEGNYDTGMRSTPSRPVKRINDGQHRHQLATRTCLYKLQGPQRFKMALDNMRCACKPILCCKDKVYIAIAMLHLEIY